MAQKRRRPIHDNQVRPPGVKRQMLTKTKTKQKTKQSLFKPIKLQCTNIKAIYNIWSIKIHPNLAGGLLIADALSDMNRQPNE